MRRCQYRIKRSIVHQIEWWTRRIITSQYRFVSRKSRNKLALSPVAKRVAKKTAHAV